MNKEDILNKSRNTKEDERKLYIERQACTNIAFMLLFIFILFSFFKYLFNQEFLDLDTVMTFLCPAWMTFLATKYYYHRKWTTLFLTILFFIFTILVIANFFVDIFPLYIFR